MGYAEQTHKCCSCSSWIKVYDAAGTLIYTLTSEWPSVVLVGDLDTIKSAVQPGCYIVGIQRLCRVRRASSVGLHPVAAVFGQLGQPMWLCIRLLC